MKVQTKDLIGPALDWFVAKCCGELYPRGCVRLHSGRLFTIDPGDSETLDAWRKYEPSTDWAQGGLLIERENISVGYQGHLGVPLNSLWYATNRVDACGFGPTPLIAAMRCYVSKLGDEVEIPDELCGGIHGL